MTDEEQNLSRRERRAQAKSGKEGSEDIKDRNQRLRAEAAIKRRRLREAERTAAAQEGLGAGERVDDALVRSADASARFLRDNFAWLQWIIVAGVVAGMAVLIYDYRKGVSHEKNGAKLAAILATEFGTVASSEPASPSDPRLVDPRSEFQSEAERAQKAAEQWARLATEKEAALEISGKLGKAGALYDQGKNGEARKIYQGVGDDPKSTLFPQMKGRAWEGVGFTFEAEGRYEDAKKAFAKLSSIETKEFQNLRDFHLARVELLLGNREKAKEMLLALDAKLSDGAGPQGPVDYVGAAVRDLLKTVDPTQAQKEQQAISAEQMKELMKQFEAMQKGEKPTLPPEMEQPGAPESTSETTPENPAAPAPSSGPSAPSAPTPTPAPAPAPAAPSPKPAPAALPSPAPVVPTAPTPTPPVPAPAPITPPMENP